MDFSSSIRKDENEESSIDANRWKKLSELKKINNIRTKSN